MLSALILSASLMGGGGWVAAPCAATGWQPVVQPGQPVRNVARVAAVPARAVVRWVRRCDGGVCRVVPVVVSSPDAGVAAAEPKVSEQAAASSDPGVKTSCQSAVTRRVLGSRLRAWPWPLARAVRRCCGR